MISDTTNNYSSPVRTINAKVDLFEGSTLADSYTKYYALKSFTIERVGESKFFGFGICQKANVHLVDKDRLIHITTADSFKIALSTGGDYLDNFPNFYVTEVHRDENTNELSVTAYDAIYKATTHTVSELELTPPYTINEFALSCANLLGIGLVTGSAASAFSTSYEEGANFDGTESIREALNAIAEATQTIYYLDSNNRLTFKRLDKSGNPVLKIGKEGYISLESGDNRRLATITHTTELGDNVTVSTSATGTTQYIRNNPFWDLREDIDTLLNNALSAVGGLTINQFVCEWRGDPALEIGDKIGLIAKDNSTVTSFLLDDVIEYDGALYQSTQWEYADTEEETEANPANLGDALKDTYAKVDKVNREITLVASQADENSEEISQLQLNAESIIASVQKVEQQTQETTDGLTEEVAELTKKTEAIMTEEDITFIVSSALDDGVSKVETETGFTFNETGLTVSKSGTEMRTTITEDGMTVYRDSEEVLIADHEGVKAEDLHATTYLIIGNNSRFEDIDNRTACFWIGG